MSEIHRNVIHTEDRGDLFDNRVSARFDPVIPSNRLDVIGVKGIMVHEVFFPDRLEIHPFGLDLEFSIIVILS